LLALAAATFATAPWYLRNAALTGNPIFPIDLAGLLPTNPVYRDVMRGVRAEWSLNGNRQDHLTLVGSLLLGAGAVGLLALPGLRVRGFGPKLLAWFVLLFAGLWLASIPYTAGGWVYSLRVLGPALPLLAVASGWWAIRLSGRGLLLLGLALLPLSADAARRSWIFVWAPFDPPWNYTWSKWRRIDAFVQASLQAATWPVLADVAQGELIVVDSPNAFILAGRAGANVTTTFSPEVDALTRTGGNFGGPAFLAELRRRHVRFIIISNETRLYLPFITPRPALQWILRQNPTLTLDTEDIYDLDQLEHAVRPRTP
ncbi:MAG: hypothetical protein ACHQ5A_02430, partial [Opitutales bacterium]